MTHPASRRRAPLVCAMLGAAVVGPGTDVTRAGDPQSFGVTATRVSVDFVVRDKDGEFLRGLTASDVEVSEDGVRQRLDSLDLVDHGADLVAGLPLPLREPPPLVAVVFDSLGPESRRAAHQAVLSHLGQPSALQPLVGLFAIDQGLRQLQAFTDNPQTVRRALGRLLTGGSTAYSGLREREAIRHAHAGLGDGSPQTSVVPAEMAGEPECRLEGDDVIRRLKVLQSRMKESFDVLERDQRGSATVNALLALVDALGAHPGRKAVLLFSEGLSVPAGAGSPLRSVVAAANRAAVSIYAADAAGLRARSAADETRRSLETLRTRLELVQAAPAGQRGPGAAEMPDSGIALLERNEDALRLAPENGLGNLAEQTGGILLHGTNDLAAGLARIEEDLATHYVLSYTPSNARSDGRYRSIRVDVARPHGSLQSRQGYFAVPTPLPSPVLESEAPILARLESGGLPTFIPVQVRVLQYPAEPPSSVVPIVVEVPTSGFRADFDGNDRLFRRDFTILTLVRDQKRQVLAKASQRYRVSSARKDGGDPVLFYREARLLPGSYTVEVLAQDALSTRAGGARATVEIEDPPAGHLRASSLMLVGRVEKVETGETGLPAPLRYQDVLLYPALASPARAPADEPIVLFLTAWPGIDRQSVEARVEVLRDGRIIHALSAGTHEAGPDGRVQLASSLAAGGLAPGVYELRMILTDGRDAETRSASVLVSRAAEAARP